MWLYVPSLSALESAASTLAWPDGVAPFVWSSGTLSPQPASWKGWRKRSWIKRLSGLTCEPSMLARGVEQSISSARAIHASHSHTLAIEQVPTTNDTCGLRSTESSKSAARPSCSAKTSEDTFRLG